MRQQARQPQIKQVIEWIFSNNILLNLLRTFTGRTDQQPQPLTRETRRQYPIDPGSEYSEQQIIKVCEAAIRNNNLMLLTDHDSKETNESSWFLKQDNSFKAEYGLITTSDGTELHFVDNGNGEKEAFSLCTAINPTANMAETSGNYRNFENALQQIHRWHNNYPSNVDYFHSVCFFLHHYSHWTFWIVKLRIIQDNSLFITDNDKDKSAIHITVYDPLPQLSMADWETNAICMKLTQLIKQVFSVSAQNHMVKLTRASTGQQPFGSSICGGICASNFTLILQHGLFTGQQKILTERPMVPLHLRQAHVHLTSDGSYLENQSQPWIRWANNRNHDAECRQLIAKLQTLPAPKKTSILNALSILHKAHTLTTYEFRQKANNFYNADETPTMRSNDNTEPLLPQQKTPAQHLQIQEIKSFINFCTSKNIPEEEMHSWLTATTQREDKEEVYVCSVHGEILFDCAHHHLKKTLIKNQTTLNDMLPDLFTSLFTENGDDYNYQDGARDKLLTMAKISVDEVHASAPVRRIDTPESTDQKFSLGNCCYSFFTCCFKGRIDQISGQGENETMIQTDQQQCLSYVHYG